MEKCPPGEEFRYKGYPEAYVREHIQLRWELDSRMRRVYEPLRQADGFIEWNEDARKMCKKLVKAFAKFEVDLLVKHHLIREMWDKEDEDEFLHDPPDGLLNRLRARLDLMLSPGRF